MMDYKVVIMGVDHHNALGIVHSLSRCGVNSNAILVGPVVDGYVLKSKFVQNGYRCNSAQDAVDLLLTNYKNEKVVVLTASDEVAVELDKAYEIIPSTIKVPNAKGRIPSLISKNTMCGMAEKVGLVVPKHCVYNVGDDLPSTLTFPCITKAISSVDGSKADTHICYSQNELKDAISNDNTCKTLIVEQFIEKAFEFQFIGLSLNGGETIVIPGHSHIIWPEIENTNYFPYLENDSSFQDTLEKTKKFIRGTGYSGLFSVEFLRGKDGKDYFLEMNFRNDGNAICATDSGYNLPYIWFLYHIGGDWKKELQKSIFSPVEYCPEFVCTYQMLSGKIAVKEWWKMIRKSNSYTIYCPGDNRPLWNNIRANIRGFSSTIIKRMLHIKR